MLSSQSEWQITTSPAKTNANARDIKVTYPFLVHSQESLSQQAPPDVDNQRLARQKRKRTSPGDHAILEAEYQRNSKPDKSARLQIVQKVALGEKEVQIWFQNRRQVTRRKSRPLSPHEILANLPPPSQYSEHTLSSSNPVTRSSQQVQLSSQSSVANFSSEPSDFEIGSSSQASQIAFVQEPVGSAQGSPEVANNLKLAEAKVKRDANTRAQKVTFNEGDRRVRAIRNGGLSRSMSQTLPTVRRPELSGIRRSASFIINNDGPPASYTLLRASESKETNLDPRIKDTGASSQPLSRTSSRVRLSMSLDGKAQVTTGTGTTPSPPRKQPSPLSDPLRSSNVGLRRSLSATDFGKQSSPSSFSNPSYRRHATGRSRDARTWEFYCDKDARDELTAQAEREESGSATAVIALIKSNSNVNKAMTMKSKKRNANTRKPEGAKRLKSEGQIKQRPKLGRSQSLFDITNAVSRPAGSVDMKAGACHRKSGSQSACFEIYEGDSDKENWVPGTQQRSTPRRRPVGLVDSRRILTESSGHPPNMGALVSHQQNVSSGISSAKSSSSNDSENKENAASEVDFGIVPREADDLDCVQNLLSLSQAAWH